MPAYMLILTSVASAAITLMLLRIAAMRRARERTAVARAAASAAVRGAEIEAVASRRSMETAAREEALEMRSQIDAELTRATEEIARREERLNNREAQMVKAQAELEARAQEIEERRKVVQSLRDRAQGLERDVVERQQQASALLETYAGESTETIKAMLIGQWVETSQAEAAQRVRAVEQSMDHQQYDREARRLMEIAVSRYQNHFLTERNVSNIRVGHEVCELLLESAEALREGLQEVSGVQLLINDEGDTVKLEGLDGVGREVARRGLNRLSKKVSAKTEARSDPHGWATKIRANLEREILALGKRAFSVLKIPRPHPDIVQLVGALNYRTSYTQNQWLHAVEASFLAGMMAAEMELDIKLARRATLMHDIGKALTHKIDGSHAVIGADIARTLGEDEIVANAIGAHHADEPPSSVYAYLVAAADAMSGARPGARRETSELFSHRVEDLERIGSRYRGVERAHAVHGGRELRIYVDEGRVDDRNVVELSSEIAERIAEEMTFPGQIKVTVIRSFEATATAN